jgi:Transposase domain (DUF772)
VLSLVRLKVKVLGWRSTSLRRIASTCSLMPPSLRECGCRLSIWRGFCSTRWQSWIWRCFSGGYRADGHGWPAHDPAMTVALASHAYAVGERSTRRIERRWADAVAFRVVTGNLAPDYATIARFLVRHQVAPGAPFGLPLGLSRTGFRGDRVRWVPRISGGCEPAQPAPCVGR